MSEAKVMILPPKHHLEETTANDPNQTRTQKPVHTQMSSVGECSSETHYDVIIITLPVDSKGRHFAGEAGTGTAPLGQFLLLFAFQRGRCL